VVERGIDVRGIRAVVLSRCLCVWRIAAPHGDSENAAGALGTRAFRHDARGHSKTAARGVARTPRGTVMACMGIECAAGDAARGCGGVVVYCGGAFVRDGQGAAAVCVGAAEFVSARDGRVGGMVEIWARGNSGAYAADGPLVCDLENSAVCSRAAAPPRGLDAHRARICRVGRNMNAPTEHARSSVLQALPRLNLYGAGLAAITEEECVGVVMRELDAQRGGCLLTMNLDLLRRFVYHPAFAALVAQADLVVADGMPLIWASHLLKKPLPERITGSNLIWSM